MSSIKPQTLKGFRDFLPAEARRRQYVINILRQVFESFGFEPLETPALEYEEILLGKYGEEGDKLMYRFTDNGDRKVALRYDQTVPLARVVAQYQNELPVPFKRYQIQNVWRAENTQKGRFREFLQCDADIVGVDSPLADKEIIAVVRKSLRALGFEKFTVLINSREILKKSGATQDFLRILDKQDKLTKDEFLRLISEAKEDNKQAYEYLKNSKPADDPSLKEIFNNEDFDLFYLPTLARGLDYYTGIIFEVKIDGYTSGSVCGGGRYDKLIGMFAGRDIPAVGFAFGFDRLIEAMEELKLFPEDLGGTKVLVTVFPASPDASQSGSLEFEKNSLETSSHLRSNNIDTEIYLDSSAKLDKQLKYADQKQIPYAIIIGPEEVALDKVVLKDLKNRTQETLTLDEVVQKLT